MIDQLHSRAGSAARSPPHCAAARGLGSAPRGTVKRCGRETQLKIDCQPSVASRVRVVSRSRAARGLGSAPARAPPRCARSAAQPRPRAIEGARTKTRNRAFSKRAAARLARESRARARCEVRGRQARCGAGRVGSKAAPDDQARTHSEAPAGNSFPNRAPFAFVSFITHGSKAATITGPETRGGGTEA